jgi:uncharacterized protein YyaL (SSP411 family)
MEWLPWTAETFARAARERKPILLSISAAWCRACHEMDRTTYADPAVQAFAAARYLAVRVDTDERPDINDRYNLGGWPTTAFLTPEGALIGGGTYLDAMRMAGVLGQVADAFARLPNGAPVAHDVPRPEDTASADRPAPAPAASDVFALFDEVYGGFGIEPKFPLTSPLRLAMALFRETQDSRYRFIVDRTLDAIADGGLCDAASGGYYRYATTRDWQLPHVEKLLDTNARLLAAFVEAASTFGREADRARARRLADFVGSLASDRGGYVSSEAGTRVFAASTARAAGALLGAAELLDDRSLAQTTLRQFEGFLLSAYRPGGGVAHFVDAGERFNGLLGDQIATGEALLAAYALTGDEPYRMMAEEVGHYALRAFPAPGGGFVDRIVEERDVGLLREPRTPYFENCDAAAFFAGLDRASRDATFQGVAQGALDRARPAAVVHGPDAACWLLAARDVAIR